MLNEEQLQAEVTVTGASAWILLQCISRLTATGSVKDVELSAVGTARDSLVAALQESTGVNYDQAKAQMEAMQRQRLAEAQAEARRAQEASAEDEAPAEVAEETDEAAA